MPKQSTRRRGRYRFPQRTVNSAWEKMRETFFLCSSAADEGEPLSPPPPLPPEEIVLGEINQRNACVVFLIHLDDFLLNTCSVMVFCLFFVFCFLFYGCFFFVFFTTSLSCVCAVGASRVCMKICTVFFLVFLRSSLVAAPLVMIFCSCFFYHISPLYCLSFSLSFLFFYFTYLRILPSVYELAV